PSILFPKRFNRNFRFPTSDKDANSPAPPLAQAVGAFPWSWLKLVHESGQFHRFVRAESLIRTLCGPFPTTPFPCPRLLAANLEATIAGDYPAGTDSIAILRSMLPKSRRASDGSPRAATSSSGHALSNARRFSPTAAASWSATRRRSAAAAYHRRFYARRIVAGPAYEPVQPRLPLACGIGVFLLAGRDFARQRGRRFLQVMVALVHYGHREVKRSFDHRHLGKTGY